MGRLRSLGKRIGRRGAFLGFLSSLFASISLSLFTAPQVFDAAPLFHYLPSEGIATAYGALAVGNLLVLLARNGHRRALELWAMGASAFAISIWSLNSALRLIDTANPAIALGLAVNLSFIGLVLLVAGWRENEG